MQINAVILGASGYGGGELLRWLSQHPNVTSIRGTSRSLAGNPFADAHPNLRGIVEGNFAAKIDWREAAEADQLVVFSALPHGELAKTLSSLEEEWRSAGVNERLLLIDLSADFRFARERTSVPFAYGLPEWNRSAIEGARRIASAGCFATALQLGLLPLRDLKVGFIAATAVTGSSGSGTAAAAGTHHPTRANDFRAYKVLSHQHAAEVELALEACHITARVSFVPQSGPFVRGIFATLQFQLPAEIDGAALNERMQTAFADCPFVRVVDTTPRISAVAGSNFADVAAAADDHTGVVMVAIDNLGKGMAGQAVQSMNIALGLEETTALRSPARYPG